MYDKDTSQRRFTKALFSSVLADHAADPKHSGPIERCTHIGKAGIKGEGRYIYLSFQVEDGIIRQAGFEAHGCLTTLGCADRVCEILIGRTPEQALNLDERDVDLLCGGLPDGKGFCAQMLAECLSRAFGGG